MNDIIIILEKSEDYEITKDEISDEIKLMAKNSQSPKRDSTDSVDIIEDSD